MVVRKKEVKSILTKSPVHNGYTANPYSGCAHNCLYCSQFKCPQNKTCIRAWNDGKGPEGNSMRHCNNITHAHKIGTLRTKQYRIPNSGLIEFDGFCRWLTRREIELAQTLPVGYTNCLSYNQMQDVCGDGWTVDVIAYIFEGLKKGEN